jgi:hypothetical protein
MRPGDKPGLNGKPMLAVAGWQMMEGVMAKVIEFYVLDSLPNKSNYMARKERGKLIEFRAPKRNQANSNSAQWPGMCMVYIAPFAANSASGRNDDTM